MSYDFSLDMSTINSNSSIIKRISPNSNILEVGCAYGRMTKYLKENLNCIIDVIEIDYKSAKSAYSWSNKKFFGKTFGNIEKSFWFKTLKNQSVTYDYIIFADVLEHLHNPFKALQRSSKLLKPNGKILISVPNISHNSVLIDLLQDKFIYREFGLLDNNHIKFFTEKSLQEMVDNCGLKVSYKENLINAVNCTEFGNNYSELPFYISDFLKKRINAEVYQFVWELKNE
jgi:2-polyprenyl-3-methyl-5-hydroxy-6-metoxy-1,4-benzoquinol methylase